MKKERIELQSRIDDFLERKTSKYPEIKSYTRDVYRLNRIDR